MSKLNRYWQIIAAIIIFLLTFPPIGIPTRLGLDPSYIWALNYFFDKGISIGKDILFSYGPLGFLLFPAPIGNNLLLAFIFEFVLKLIFIILLLKLGSLVRKKDNLTNKITIFIIIFFIASFVEFMHLFIYLLPFLAITALLVFKETGKRIYLISGIVVSVIGGLTSIPNTVSCLLILFSFVLWHFLIFPKGKGDLYNLSFIFVGLIFSLVFFWVLFGRDIAGILPYFRGIIEIAKGNSSAMSLTQQDNWLLVVIFLGFFIGLPLMTRVKRIYFLYGVFLLPLFFIAKYAYSREDFSHVRFFFDYLVLFYLLVLLYSERIKAEVVLIMLASLITFGLNVKLVFPGENFNPMVVAKRLIRFDGWNNFSQSTLFYKEHKKRLESESQTNLQPAILPTSILNIINSKTVDVYPWEASLLAANHLKFRPRPIFQSYIAFTPWLDKKNADFLLSSLAPEFILWDTEHWGHWGGEMGSIDWRYLPNDEPITFMTMLNRYNLIRREGSVGLLQKNQFPNFQQPVIIKIDNAVWNKWIDVPQLEGGVLRADIEYSRTLLGNLARLIWKEPESYIEYRLVDQVKKHRLVTDNIVSGIWVSPYLRELTTSFAGDKVTQIRLQHTSSFSFRPEMRVKWVFYSIIGKIP